MTSSASAGRSSRSTWTGSGGLLHGDAGNSLAAQEPVSDLLGDKVVNSAFLVFCAGLISIPLSVAIGAYAALRRDRTFDVTSSLTTLVFAALPEFVVGISLVVIFATTIFPGFLPAITIIAAGHAAVGQHGGDDPADRSRSSWP